MSNDKITEIFDVLDSEIARQKHNNSESDVTLTQILTYKDKKLKLYIYSGRREVKGIIYIYDEVYSQWNELVRLLPGNMNIEKNMFSLKAGLNLYHAHEAGKNIKEAENKLIELMSADKKKLLYKASLIL